LAKIDVFEMERLQSLYWHEVEYDLSESGVAPLSLDELLRDNEARRALLDTRLGYPLSEGSERTRAFVAEWYDGADVENVTITNGGSEANLVALWSLLDPGDRLAFMVPNYLQGWGLGRHFGDTTDTFGLVRGGDGWSLDVDALERAIGPRTKAVMVCNRTTRRAMCSPPTRWMRSFARPNTWARGSSPTRSTAGPRSTRTGRRRRSGDVPIG
jgi:DNA-binding transcriptional MocR family regulator